MNEPADHELDVFRQNSSLQGNPVSDIPAIPFGDPDARQSRGLLLHESVFLFGRERMNIRINSEKTIRIHGKLREKVRWIFVNASHPLIGADFDDSRSLRIFSRYEIGKTLANEV